MIAYQFPFCDTGFHSLRIAVEVRRCRVDVVVVDLLGLGDLVELALAVLREAQLDERVLPSTVGRALAKELDPPGRHARGLERVYAEGSVLDAERSEQFHGRRRRRPSEGMARGDQAGVACARRGRRLQLPPPPRAPRAP